MSKKTTKLLSGILFPILVLRDFFLIARTKTFVGLY